MVARTEAKHGELFVSRCRVRSEQGPESEETSVAGGVGVAGNRVLVSGAWAVEISLGEREPLKVLEEESEMTAVEPGEDYPVIVLGMD